jgi:sigma-B regulation protein RsbU (phosphoserine phosphatase)
MHTELMRQLYTVGELRKHMLPRQLPVLDGWSIATHNGMGLWPGGDYYDFFPLPDHRLMMVCADASDPGGAGTALVAMIRVVLHACPLSSGADQLPFCPVRNPIVQPPHIVLGHLNRVLVENSLEEQFATAFCAVLDPIDGTLHYANAGHPQPLWWQAEPGVVEPLRDGNGLPLGLDRCAAYHHRRTQFAPGDILVVYTDGLVGAANAEGQPFGINRLEIALRENAAGGAAATKLGILAALQDFLGPKKPHDDVTLIVLERL